MRQQSGTVLTYHRNENNVEVDENEYHVYLWAERLLYFFFFAFFLFSFRAYQLLCCCCNFVFTERSQKQT